MHGRSLNVVAICTFFLLESASAQFEFEHHFGDPYAVGVVRLAPGQVTFVRIVPSEDLPPNLHGGSSSACAFLYGSQGVVGDPGLLNSAR